jgi:hypothetical protein
LVKPEHVGVFILYFNVNFKILKQFNCVLGGQIKDTITSRCTMQLQKKMGIVNQPTRQPKYQSEDRQVTQAY